MHLQKLRKKFSFRQYSNLFQNDLFLHHSTELTLTKTIDSLLPKYEYTIVLLVHYLFVAFNAADFFLT